MRNVAVVFGGQSAENEISVLTGVFVLNVLDREKYNPIPIYIHYDGGLYTSSKMFQLKTFQEKKFASFERIFLDGGTMYAFNTKKRHLTRMGKLDVALNCCHGGLGEGGGVSAMMAWNGIPLASPDLMASGVLLDKCMTKVAMRGLGIPTLEYIRVNEGDYRKRGAFLLKRISTRFKYPVVIKPAQLGSSIGITLAHDEREVKKGIELGFTLDHRLLIEPYLANKKDVNCAAYMRKGEIFVSEPEIAFGKGIYSFEDKYINRAEEGTFTKDRMGRNSSNKPPMSALTKENREKIRSYTKTIYKRLNLRGAVRMDYLVSEGKVYLSEVNTVPGSLAYYLFCERISDAKVFFGELLEEAVERFAEQQKNIPTTNILHTASILHK